MTDAWYGKGLIELYRPLQGVTFMLDAQWGADIAFVTHLTNLILHIFTCMSLYYLLIMLNIRKNLALLGALIYSVHFLFLHAVIWIPARGDLLLALFAFLSMITLIKTVNNKRWYYFILHIVLFSLTLLSKESAIVLPLLYFLYTWLFSRQFIKQKNNLLLQLSYIVIIAIFFVIKNASVNPTTQFSLSFSSVISNMQMAPETIAKFLIPISFSTLPVFKLYTTMTGIIIIILVAIVYAIKFNLFNKLAIFSLCWFFLLLLPGMAYRPGFVSYTYDYLDHRSYVICFGLLLIVLNILQETGADTKKYFRVAGICLLIYLASVNLYFSRSYKNPMAYAEQALRTNPKSNIALFIHASESTQQGNVEAALDDYSQMIKISPDDTTAIYNRAVIYFDQKLYKDALSDFNQLLTIKPDYSAASYIARGKIELLNKNFDAANKDFETAARLDPLHQKDLDALKQNRTLQLNGEKAVEFNRAGVREALNGKHKEAVIYFQKALAANPEFQVARENLLLALNNAGLSEGKKGNYKIAITYFQKVIAMNPEQYNALSNLGNCKFALGDREGACLDWKKATEHGASNENHVRYCK